jgi:hypothetical protein
MTDLCEHWNDADGLLKQALRKFFIGLLSAGIGHWLFCPRKFKPIAIVLVI